MVEVIGVKKNMGGLRDVFENKQSEYVQNMYDKFSKNIESRII